MLPTSRILAALLTGLGIALIVGALVAPRFLIGDGRLPLDLENTTWTIQDPEGSYQGEPKPVTRQLHMEMQNPSDDNTVSVRVGESLLAGQAANDFENLVSAQTWAFPMDRVTGAPVAPLQLTNVMILPATEVTETGPWLKLPADVKPESYDVFDSTLRGTVEAAYVGEGRIAGRDVYTFRQTIPPTNLAMRYADMANTKTQTDPEGNQTRSFRYYAATRELTVDQITGLVVGVSEDVDQFYGDAEGRREEDIVRYSGRMPQEQTEGLAQQLGGVFSQAQSRSFTLALAAVGAVLALAGLIVALRPPRRTASRPSA